MILFKPDLLSIGNKATERLTPFHLKTFGNNLSEFLLVLQDRDMEDQFIADPPPTPTLKKNFAPKKVPKNVFLGISFVT